MSEMPAAHARCPFPLSLLRPLSATMPAASVPPAATPPPGTAKASRAAGTEPLAGTANSDHATRLAGRARARRPGAGARPADLLGGDLEPAAAGVGSGMSENQTATTRGWEGRAAVAP